MSGQTQHLDRIGNLLKPWAHDATGWTLTENPYVTVVSGSSTETFDGPAEAFAEAQRFAASLVDEHVAAANRVELGAKCTPLEGEGWRATVDLVLSERERLIDGHREVLL